MLTFSKWEGENTLPIIRLRIFSRYSSVLGGYLIPIWDSLFFWIRSSECFLPLCGAILFSTSSFFWDLPLRGLGWDSLCSSLHLFFLTCFEIFSLVSSEWDKQHHFLSPFVLFNHRSSLAAFSRRRTFSSHSLAWRLSLNVCLTSMTSGSPCSFLNGATYFLEEV